MFKNLAQAQVILLQDCRDYHCGVAGTIRSWTSEGYELICLQGIREDIVS